MSLQYNFSALDYARAIAPVKLVLDSFQRETKEWRSLEAQGQFVEFIKSLRADGGPFKSYLKRLVQQYVARVEACSEKQIEDDSLVVLILELNMAKDVAIPDPLESCYVSFRIPSDNDSTNDLPLRLRVFPRHNDVALKLWEAGACLAEYLLENPQYVAGKDCCELGSGIGLTGLVVAGCCQAKSVYMTDYTEACLTNLKHNIRVNSEWLQARTSRQRDELISEVSFEECSMSSIHNLISSFVA